MPHIQPSAPAPIAPEFSDLDASETDSQDPATEALALVQRINERIRKASENTPLGVQRVA